MSWELCRVVDNSLNACERIATTAFQDAEPSWVAEAALALLLINLKDALLSLNRLGHRVSFTDDIDRGDITDLVATMRNAICHNGSPLRMFGNGSVISFARMHGAGTLMQFGDLVLGSPYDDDVAFFYGTNRVFLIRHLYRAIREAQQTFRLVASDFNYKIWD